MVKASNLKIGHAIILQFYFMKLHYVITFRSALEVLESGEVVPVGFPSVTEMQQDIALVHAAGPSCTNKLPVTAAECFEALQVRGTF